MNVNLSADLQGEAQTKIVADNNEEPEVKGKENNENNAVTKLEIMNAAENTQTENKEIEEGGKTLHEDKI